jgi:3-deoxy-D-manno-octulosonic-acid transferase
MAETKTTVMRLGGRMLAGLIKHVVKSSHLVYEPADLRSRLRETHPCIIASWHGQFMMLAHLHPGDIKVAAMVAKHGDAELIGEAMLRLNTGLIRGAGAGERKRDRGGAQALRAAVQALKDDTSLVMTADIPPGPARIAGVGIIMIARLSGCPIVPVACATKRFLSFDTWSRMTVNLPYSKLVFVGGDPISVPRDADAGMLEAKRLELETALNAATVKAYALAGADISRATPLDQLAAQSPPSPGLGLKIYRTALSAMRPAAPLLLTMRERRGKENPRRRGERLGQAQRPRPLGPLVWVHAASVGETNAVLPLIDSILAHNDQSHVLLTTGTVTSADLAESRLPTRAFHQYVPLDVPIFAARFLDHWRPDTAIFTESDLWPNIVLATAERKIPLALVNARMSPRSMKRWRSNARFGRPMFSRFSVILSQNKRITKTLKWLGAPNVITSGNLKIDAPPPPVDVTALDALRSAIGTRPVFLAASTHEGEDAMIAAAHKLMRRNLPDLLTIIVPRHPERGLALSTLLNSQGHRATRRSERALPDSSTDIYIADTIGELGTLYALAPVAFIGGSLIPHGGQNPIEAVRHGTCVLSGPHNHNFRDAYLALREANACVIVSTADEIARSAELILSNAAEAQRIQNSANEALDQLSGALAITMTALQPILPKQTRG